MQIPHLEQSLLLEEPRVTPRRWGGLAREEPTPVALSLRPRPARMQAHPLDTARSLHLSNRLQRQSYCHEHPPEISFQVQDGAIGEWHR